MISNIHYIEVYINGELIELESQDSLNLRINNVLFDPTKTTTTQAEYSYSFDIPSTPKNDRILNYANNLSRINKFHSRYSSQVYADGNMIFDGSLTIQKYSSKDKMYTCNLVTIKQNSLDDIFGEMVMTDLKWEVPFNGAETINEINANGDTKYYFPLVSYGVFQKNYVSRDEVAATYTPKHNLDKYNKWWVESFYPSLNMMETVKRAFESKGYKVGGNAFFDENINNIYASCNLSNDQIPSYNLGNQKFGSLSLSLQYSSDSDDAYSQNLSYPYMKYTLYDGSESLTEGYNFPSINIYNLLGNNMTLASESYMVQTNENLIVVPESGFYRIRLSAATTILTQTSSVTASQNIYSDSEKGYVERDTEIGIDINEGTPIEIALIRNYDNNYELIKGKNNIRYRNGDPNDNRYGNKITWLSCFPHEDAFMSEIPTETNDLFLDKSEQERISKLSPNDKYWTNKKLGYVYNDGQIMCYDPAVSNSFICGISSFGGGVASVMRNGKSWSKASTRKNDVFYQENGYSELTKTASGYDSGIIVNQTQYNSNEYHSAPTSNVSVSADKRTMNGQVSCMMYLEKNDVLQVVAVQRGLYTKEGNGVYYNFSVNANLDLKAITPKNFESAKASQLNNYFAETEFPTQLNLFNFTNKDKKVSEWISDVQKAFNLEILQKANTIEINTNKGLKKNNNYAIDVDDRVSSDEAESEYISYPKEMSVRYKIDTDEWGFELTVPPEHINDEGDTWKEWGDSGFTIIQLNDDTYETSSQNTQTNFSYTYYDNFLWKEVLENGEEAQGSGLTITIPVISKAEFMAEGYGYEEAMKNDGYSLPQRFWYREQPSQEYVWLDYSTRRKVWLTYPSNVHNGFNLSYKNNELSIVTEYFNIKPMLSSNYVNIDLYLTPTEYKDIKNGALLHFDSDLYYCGEVNGYDPQGGNTTELKLIKKS